MSQEQSSHQALSDPLPRLYSCFCDKFFTTYPGIYLHLKSKHSNLFQRYKKLKITKLFRKVRDQKGNQLYKLDKLSENDSSNSYFNEKKAKQDNKKKNNKQTNEKEANKNEQLFINRKKIINNNFNNSYRHTDNFINQNYNNKNLIENHLEKYQKNNNFYSSIYSPPFYNYMYQQPINNFSGFFNPFFQGIPNPISDMTTKKLIQQYLSMASEKNLEQLPLIKNYLYDLMVFIDKNYELVNDPRAKMKPFVFSYCDDFEPRYLGIILLEYINLLRNRSYQEEITNKQIFEQREHQLRHVQKFIIWLKQMNLIENMSEGDLNQYVHHDVQRQEFQFQEKIQKIQSVNKKMENDQQLESEQNLQKNCNKLQGQQHGEYQVEE